MSNIYQIPDLPLQFKFESLAMYKQLTLASRALAELKGVAKTIPNESILLNTLVLQEAKDSSEVENIVTTQDEVYQADLDMVETVTKAAQKEVLRYRQAMHTRFALVRKNKLLTNAVIKQIQQELEENATGIEKESQQFVRYPMHSNIDSCTEVILFTEGRDVFIRGKLVMTKSRRCKIDEVMANTLESELKKLPVKFEKATSNAKTYYKVTVENADVFDKPYETISSYSELETKIRENGLNEVLFRTSPKVIDVIF